ncbi:MAG: hypothetical protein GY873_18190 [Bosea sp.]|uniref:hypothetical protein n=1 Tax=Bosea sp. (in: a-proteobacteria) TaxID=1871050 RepID=UPI002394A523|nr:hypothetical protein [Bosea sp. (in: a-proteobacteria)]MCP4736118.1 hypothetical protein [Bosea sp. (in: a-proteobacteria)]
MPLLTRAALLAIAIALSSASSAQETRTFEAADGAYSFQYPPSFGLDRQFADGTGNVTGVKASSPANGDVIITFLGPRDPGGLAEISERTREAIADEFRKAIAVRPAITLQSSAMTTMLGQPAVDMVFSNARWPFTKERPQIKRYVFTVANGKAYNFECIYRDDKAAEFAPVCGRAVSTLRLNDAAATAAPGR